MGNQRLDHLLSKEISLVVSGWLLVVSERRDPQHERLTTDNEQLNQVKPHSIISVPFLFRRDVGL